MKRRYGTIETRIWLEDQDGNEFDAIVKAEYYLGYPATHEDPPDDPEMEIVSASTSDGPLTLTKEQKAHAVEVLWVELEDCIEAEKEDRYEH
tara:strand:+ start:203 stop:478 length:276 start_codon:yes stop_codon:yes gene_type:complete